MRSQGCKVGDECGTAGSRGAKAVKKILREAWAYGATNGEAVYLAKPGGDGWEPGGYRRRMATEASETGRAACRKLMGGNGQRVSRPRRTVNRMTGRTRRRRTSRVQEEQAIRKRGV